MSLLDFKFIKRLIAPAPVNLPLAEGDRIDEALNKLQGQIDASGGGSASVPTRIASDTNFEVPGDSQMLFTKIIRLDDGARIILDGILVEVD